MSTTAKNSLLTGIVVSIGIALAGFFIGNTLIKSKKYDRSVIVKGLAEQEVNANLAIWPISFSETSNELAEIQTQLERKTTIINDFLINQGFSKAEISNGIPSIHDNLADRYGNPNYNQNRYIGTRNITVRTTDIEMLDKAITDISSLIGQGIVLGQNNWQLVEYLYTGLNEIKPSMIEKATKNARKAAEKFALDSGSKVGKIKKANQGLFSINNRDMNTPQIKKVRVVTTIEYYLSD